MRQREKHGCKFLNSHVIKHMVKEGNMYFLDATELDE